MILKINGEQVVSEDKIAQCMDSLNNTGIVTELSCQGWAMEYDFYNQIFEFVTNLF